MKKHIYITLTTKETKKGEVIERTRRAELEIAADTRTTEIFQFVADVKKIEREAIKAAKAGTFCNMSLTEIRTRPDGDWIGGPGNTWECNAEDVNISETWPEENGFYFRPYAKNENPNYDMFAPFGKLTEEINF